MFVPPCIHVQSEAMMLLQMTKKILKTLESTRFTGCPVVAVAAKPGGPESSPAENALGVDQLITVQPHTPSHLTPLTPPHLTQVLTDCVFVPKRTPEGPFIFSVDHCFPIRGQGTVMTGTVLSGSISVNDVRI